MLTYLFRIHNTHKHRRGAHEAALRRWLEALEAANSQLRAMGHRGHAPLLRQQVGTAWSRIAHCLGNAAQRTVCGMQRQYPVLQTWKPKVGPLEVICMRIQTDLI